MTLEVTHCQATKRPNRGFVEGLMYILESRFQPAKMPNRGSVNTRYLWLEGLMNLEEYFSKWNYYKCIHKIHPGLWFHDLKWIGFLGQENSDYELTFSHVTLSRGSQEAEGFELSGRQNTEKYLNESKYPWSESLIILSRITFSCCQNIDQRSWGLNDKAGIAFSGRRNAEKLLNGKHVFFNQESHAPWRISFSGHQKNEQRLCEC
jgi:hypothetical protein